MSVDQYQTGYSSICPESVFDIPSRQRKSRTLLTVLKHRLGERLNGLRLLDTGAATGVMANYLAPHFKLVAGIDIDTAAVEFAHQNFSQSNLYLQAGDGLHIPYAANTFDVVICAHVYEHVPDANRLMAEIHRVLKPGGWCYFAAGNRLQIMEPHYGLPFLSWLPRTIAHHYMQRAGKGNEYYEMHRTLEGLLKLVEHFRRVDYTRKIIADPKFFHAEYMLPNGSLKTAGARLVARCSYCLLPSYIWMLQKI